MDVLTAILGTILLMIGLTIFALRKLGKAIVSNARAFYDSVGEKKFLFIKYGPILQWKIRQYCELFVKAVFSKETPEEKERAAVKPKITFKRLRYGTDQRNNLKP
jgi:hypothetical protein